MSFNDLLVMKLLSNKCPVGKVKKQTVNPLLSLPSLINPPFSEEES